MLKVLSLFSGIGAFETALTRLNIDYELVNFSEIDKYAIKSYCLLHNVNENKNLGDIIQINEKLLSDFDLMTWGFPCTSFSIAGKKDGFEDNQGNKTASGLYFDGIRILKEKKPKWSIIENVKALTFKKFSKEFHIILDDLKEVGYNNYWKVLNARDFGIPQNRERIFIVSIRKDIDDYNFSFPKKQKLNIFLYDLLEKEVDEKYYISEKAIERFLKKDNYKPQINPEITGTINTKNNSGQLSMDKGTTFVLNNQEISNCITKNYAQNRTLEEMEKSRGQLVQIGYINKNSQGQRIYDNSMANNLTSIGGGGGAKTGLYKLSERIRRLTPKECFRLMGFKDEQFDKLSGISDSQLYKLAGNSIVVNVLEAIFYKLFINKKYKLSSGEVFKWEN